jgi:hypothetical protein
MRYLESLSTSDPPDVMSQDGDPRNVWSPSRAISKSVPVHSPTPRGSKNTVSGNLEELAHSRVSYGDDKVDDKDDGESNVQEGQRSELGSLHNIGGVSVLVYATCKSL